MPPEGSASRQKAAGQKRLRIMGNPLSWYRGVPAVNELEIVCLFAMGVKTHTCAPVFFFSFESCLCVCCHQYFGGKPVKCYKTPSCDCLR